MRKKRLLFVINTMGRAGAENALLELLRRIDKERYEVSLYVLTGQGEMIDKLPPGINLLNKSFNSASVHTGEGRKYLLQTVIKSSLSKGALIKNFPYLIKNGLDMIKKGRILPEKLLWRVISDGAPRSKKTYDLAVAYIEGASAYYVCDHVKAKKKAAFIHIDYKEAGYTRKLDRDCYLKFDRIFGVSDEVADVFKQVYPELKEKTGVFHNLLDVEGIREKSKNGEGFEDGFEGIRLLTIGRLMRQKAFEVSIKACSILKKCGRNVKWYVLGEGEERKKLEALIDKLDLKEDFILYGAVDNPYPYLRQADIYVHCSKFEGKSIAIQEAQILGKPIVVSDCSGNREQVDDGEDGVICDFNPKSIAKAVDELIKNSEKREFIAKNALKRNENEDSLSKLLDI
ncbi:MAG: glycosyltransferase [Lachnospiraceae bacterium]|nr:glycosyltransferase [Lachnospiraceae bacterium]